MSRRAIQDGVTAADSTTYSMPLRAGAIPTSYIIIIIRKLFSRASFCVLTATERPHKVTNPSSLCCAKYQTRQSDMQINTTATTVTYTL